MSKTVAIVQSNYIPWKGYFDLIDRADEFILYDDVQYTRRDWRNRNRIKTPQGLEWLTVPVKVKGRYHQTIADTEIEGEEWAERHWKTLRAAYARATHFALVAPAFEPLYAGARFTHLSALNRALIGAVCSFLGIRTRLSSSSDYSLSPGRSERLAALCEQAGATEYVSGPAARAYLDEAAFSAKGIRVEWFDYGGYPEYPQLWGPFAHEVSVLDLLFNCGNAAPRYMKFVPR